MDFFKKALQYFEDDEKKNENLLGKFLEFSTSLKNLPRTGQFPNGQKLVIRFLPLPSETLPVAHTCFFAIDFPVYNTLEETKTKLYKAIEMGALPFAIS